MSQDLERHRRARALFEELREQPPAARAEALAAACAGDAGLQSDVADLLAAAAAAGSFLEHGAARALESGEGLVGRRLGPYEIEAVVGEGGMGTVYRARDASLGRDVALKVLPERLAAAPDRVARFRREAQILAALNHPRIAAIYGLEESDGVPVLVLEHVPGETLADRLARGRIPVDEAVAISRQIAEALEAAHAQGIVHRDLKPANVKLRPDGTVKVLDFGLAKGLEAPGTGVDGSEMATLSGLTGAGMILGTAAYMSPEQARGRPVDKRTDLWAFGCVLFEMLTGKRAFPGDDAAGTLAAILTGEPEWSALPGNSPSSVRRLLRRCLAKDRERRIADAADARLELEGDADESPPEKPRRRWARLRTALPWAVAAVAVAVALTAGRGRDRPPGDSSVYRASILLPGKLGARRSVPGATVALSPDGRRLAFVADDPQGTNRLWMRPLDGLAAQPLPDTADASSPFWSPDSRWLAFIQDGRLRKIDPSTGQIFTLCDSAVVGGSWSAQDQLLFTDTTASLAVVSAAGGKPSAVTTIDFNLSDAINWAPHFLPGGRDFIYVSLGQGSVRADVYLASLDAGPPTKLPIEAPVVQYAGNRLFYLRGTTLMAQPFDVGRRAFSGEAVPVVEQVRIDKGWIRNGVFSVSPSGALVFQRDATPGHELVWYDRSGRRLGTLGSPADYADTQISPDGGRVLVSVAEPGTAKRDLWIFDVARGLRTRFTFDDARPVRTPVWSPDGSRVAFASVRDGRIMLLQKAVQGAGELAVLLDDGFDKEPTSWSPDGRHILYVRRRSMMTIEPWVAPLEGGQAPFELAQPRARFPMFSPDGRWIVFASNESGRVEAYVSAFPGPGSRWQVSVDGGFNPRWRADGREIFYSNPKTDMLMSVEVRLGPDRVEVGEARPLFRLPWIGPRFTFDVAPDGQRILAVTEMGESAATPLTLVVNWPALLEK